METVIVCPICGAEHREYVTGSLSAWACPSCRTNIFAPADACCVWCAFATLPCSAAHGEAH